MIFMWYENKMAPYFLKLFWNSWWNGAFWKKFWWKNVQFVNLNTNWSFFECCTIKSRMVLAPLLNTGKYSLKSWCKIKNKIFPRKIMVQNRITFNFNLFFTKFFSLIVSMKKFLYKFTFSFKRVQFLKLFLESMIL